MRNYPTGPELANQLTLYKFAEVTGVDPNTLDLDSLAEAAQAEWERRTNWYPFLAERDETNALIPSIRTFDPPGLESGPVGLYAGLGNMGGSRKLFLKAGIAVADDVLVAVAVSPTSPDGSPQVLGRDYWLRPNNATALKYPYTYIEFRTPQYGEPQSIAVTGNWGFCASLPEDVYRAVLSMGLLLAVPGLAFSINNGMTELKIGEVTRRWVATGQRGPLDQQAMMWGDAFDRARARYRRVGIS